MNIPSLFIHSVDGHLSGLGLIVAFDGSRKIEQFEIERRIILRLKGKIHQKCERKKMQYYRNTKGTT